MQAMGHRDVGRDLKEDTLKETQTWGIDGCGETQISWDGQTGWWERVPREGWRQGGHTQTCGRQGADSGEKTEK